MTSAALADSTNVAADYESRNVTLFTVSAAQPPHTMNRQRVTTSVPVSGGEVGLSREQRRRLPLCHILFPSTTLVWSERFLWNWVGKWWTCSAGSLRADRSLEVREAGCDSKVGSSKCGWETVAEENSTLSDCWGEFHWILYRIWLFWQRCVHSETLSHHHDAEAALNIMASTKRWWIKRLKHQFKSPRRVKKIHLVSTKAASLYQE